MFTDNKKEEEKGKEGERIVFEESNVFDYQPIFIGIAGGTASGKTTISQKIISVLNKNNILSAPSNVALISLDSFYRDLTVEESVEAAKRNFDFDSENSFDFVDLYNTLQKIKKGEAVKVFSYDFVENKRKLDSFEIIEKPDVVILEGILTLHNEHIRKLLNIKLFIECDPDTRLARRIERDIKYRGRKIENILEQYFKFVKPAYDYLVHPSRRYADLAVNTNKGKNAVVVELICVWIKDIIVRRHGFPFLAPSPGLTPSPRPSLSNPSFSPILSTSPSPSSFSGEACKVPVFVSGPIVVSDD